jgi:hypothetical protein
MLARDGGCCTKPSTKTCASLAVTAVEGAQTAEVEQSALRPNDDLRRFRPHAWNGSRRPSDVYATPVCHER